MFKSGLNNLAKRIAKATEPKPKAQKTEKSSAKKTKTTTAPEVQEAAVLAEAVKVLETTVAEIKQPVVTAVKQRSKEAEAAMVLLKSAGNVTSKVLDLSPMKILRGIYNAGKSTKNGVVAGYQVGKGLYKLAKLNAQVNDAVTE